MKEKQVTIETEDNVGKHKTRKKMKCAENEPVENIKADVICLSTKAVKAPKKRKVASDEERVNGNNDHEVGSKKRFKGQEVDEVKESYDTCRPDKMLNGESTIKKEKKKKSSEDVGSDGVAMSKSDDIQQSKSQTVQVNGKKLKDALSTHEQPSETTSGSFKNFRISEKLSARLIEKGITSLFPVQTMSYDLIFDNFDVIVQARTGSGKTLSFAIPLVERLLQKNVALKPRRPPQVLVLVPTRELAKQVSDTFEMICDPLSVLCVYGGTPIIPQANSLRAGVDILVGTPGRIQDFIRRGNLDLSQLSHVVLDEVDRMLDMGFADDVGEILKERYKEGDVESNPQTLLFSATLPQWVHQTAQKYLRADRKHLDLVGDEIRTSKTVQHLAICCGYFDRASTIGAVLQVYSGSQGRAMIFCETKREADELALNPDIRQETNVIHGDIPQAKRDMVLSGFREGRYRCLIATDVAARGLDIPEVDLVIQCCPPKDVESYIHRSGRTGRAGRDGTCVLFYKPKEDNEIGFVERKAGICFKRIGPPTAADIIKACTEDAVRTLEAVNKSTLKHFKDVAEKLIKEKDAVEIVSAALAIISGNAEMKPRSLLSSREGFTTFLFRTTIKMDRLGYVWRAIERCIEPELKEKISWMTFCADKQGCVFDVPSELTDTILEQWKDGRSDTLVVASELPELLKPEKSLSGGFNGRPSSNGWHNGNSFNGGRGRNSFGSRGGQRREWGAGRGGQSGWNRDFKSNGVGKGNGHQSNGFKQNNTRTFFDE